MLELITTAAIEGIAGSCLGCSQRRSADETTLSRFRSDNRFDWDGVLEDVGEQLQAYDLTRAHEDGILIVDDTIVEKAKTSAAEMPD